MKEYAFAYTPPSVPGRIVFSLASRGRLPHEMVLVLLPEDLPPLDVQLRGSARRPASIIADVPAQAPGSTTSVAVDLPPGRYGFVCFVRDPDGQQHDQKGMSSEFRIPEG